MIPPGALIPQKNLPLGGGLCSHHLLNSVLIIYGHRLKPTTLAAAESDIQLTFVVVGIESNQDLGIFKIYILILLFFKLDSI